MPAFVSFFTDRRLRHVVAVAGITATALALAACGGGNKSSNKGASAGGSYGSPSKPATPSGATTLQTRKTKLGKILVDSNGRTLYLFEKDKGPKSTCSGPCAQVWPPLTTSGKPAAGPGVKPSLLATTKRSDGKAEVVYNGHPLYLYAADAQPGDTKGQGLDQFGAEWYALFPAGTKAERAGS